MMVMLMMMMMITMMKVVVVMDDSNILNYCCQMVWMQMKIPHPLKNVLID